jgi:hypothetical protein
LARPSDRREPFGAIAHELAFGLEPVVEVCAVGRATRLEFECPAGDVFVAGLHGGRKRERSCDGGV